MSFGSWKSFAADSTGVIPLDALNAPTKDANGLGITLTCSRATTGTYVDAATGLVKTALANVPRFEAQGLLVEPAQTNEILYSQDFSQAATWVLVNQTEALSALVDPAGGLTACDLTASDASNSCIQTVTVATPGDTYCFSVYVRCATGTQAGHILLLDGVTVLGTTAFTATTTWQRISVSGITTTGVTHSKLTLTSSSGVVTVWGAQLEDSGTGFETVPSSYIATTTVPVSRAADAVTPLVAGTGIDLLGPGGQSGGTPSIGSVTMDVCLYGSYTYGDHANDGPTVFTSNASGTYLGQILIGLETGYHNLLIETQVQSLEYRVPAGFWNSVHNVGVGWDAVNAYIFLDHLIVGTMPLLGDTVTAFNAMQLGSFEGDYYLTGHIKNYRVSNTTFGAL